MFGLKRFESFTKNGVAEAQDHQFTNDNDSDPNSVSPSPSSDSVNTSMTTTSTAELEPTIYTPRQNIMDEDDGDTCFDEVQHVFLGGVPVQEQLQNSHNRKANATPKTLFSSSINTQSNNNHHHDHHHDRNNSDSSSEDLHSERMMIMMPSSPLPPRNNTSSREKQRRRVRSSSSRRSSFIDTSSSSGTSLSQSLLLVDDSYEKDSDHEIDSNDNSCIQSPLVVVRRNSSNDKLSSGSSPSSSYKRRSSSHTTKRPTVVSSFNGYPIGYSYPELSSESSSDSSPSGLVADMHRLQRQQHQNQNQHQHQHQHQTVSSQEQHSSSGRLSLLSKSNPTKCGQDSPSGGTCIGSPTYNCSPFSTISPTSNSNSLLSTKRNSNTNNNNNKTTTNVKSWCLSGTFMSMVIFSLSGMVFLTNRAVIPTTGMYELEKKHFVTVVPNRNRPDNNLSAAGLRGKMILGRMRDNTNINNENQPRSTDNSSDNGDNNVSGGGNINNVQSGGGKHKHDVGSSKKKQRTTKHPSSSSKQNSQSKTKKRNTKEKVIPHRLQMHMPPSLSNLEPKFELVDPNLYYSPSISQNDNNNNKADNSKIKLQHQQSNTVPYPRVMLLDPLLKRVNRKIKAYPADFSDNTQLYGTLPSDDERLSRMEMRAPYSEGECVPMQEWQTTSHPSCNGMHELALQTIGAKSDKNNGNNKDYNYNTVPVKFRKGEVEGLSANLFGTGGFWRYAWKVDLDHYDYQKETTDTVVLKTLKYEHNFEDAHFEHDRVDAIAMERLTSSPHVINIFGFCGHSVMTEYADGSRLGALADKSRKKPLERLRIARDIANGLADVHGIDGDGNTTFVHLDINPANVVSVNGTLKLNDFNIGIIRQWNTTSNEACGFPTQYPNPQWRSPEEARNVQHLTEKVDIFSLGHIFFRLICGHEPWNKLEPGGRPSKEAVNDKVQRGVLPFIPDHVRDSNDPEVTAIRDVMLNCYNFDPSKRPSARDIAKTFDKTLNVLPAVSKLSRELETEQKKEKAK